MTSTSFHLVELCHCNPVHTNLHICIYVHLKVCFNCFFLSHLAKNWPEGKGWLCRQLYKYLERFLNVCDHIWISHAKRKSAGLE